jgi:hypothetical protein
MTRIADEMVTSTLRLALEDAITEYTLHLLGLTNVEKFFTT